MQLTITQMGKRLEATLIQPSDDTIFLNIAELEPLKTLFGAWSKRDVVPGDWYDDAVSLETDLGRQLDVLRNYHTPNFIGPTAREREVAAAGRFMFLNWKPVANWPDASGSNPTVNARISTVAAGLRDLLVPLDLTIFHEPKDNLSATNTHEAYRAMWRNVVTIFNDSGATNVRFVFVGVNAPTTRDDELLLFPLEAQAAYYDPYVPNAEVDPVAHFDEKYEWWADTFRPWADLPIGWSEWGVGLNPYTPTPERQVNAYLDLADAFDAGAWPRLESISYFDSNYAQVQAGALPAFASLANLPRFTPTA